VSLRSSIFMLIFSSIKFDIGFSDKNYLSTMRQNTVRDGVLLASWCRRVDSDSVSTQDAENSFSAYLISLAVLIVASTSRIVLCGGE
jgi:hypothetical protein